MKSTVMEHLEVGETVEADYFAPRRVTWGTGREERMPALISVRIGDCLVLMGAPEVVLRTLREAVRCAAEAEHEGTGDAIPARGGAA